MDVVLEGIVNDATRFASTSELGSNVFYIPVRPESVQLNPSESETHSFDRKSVEDYVIRSVNLVIYCGHYLPIVMGNRVRIDFHESERNLLDFHLPAFIQPEKIYLLDNDGSVVSTCD